jgi:hypothetical protein
MKVIGPYIQFSQSVYIRDNLSIDNRITYLGNWYVISTYLDTISTVHTLEDGKMLLDSVLIENGYDIIDDVIYWDKLKLLI